MAARRAPRPGKGYGRVGAHGATTGALHKLTRRLPPSHRLTPEQVHAAIEKSLNKAYATDIMPVAMAQGKLDAPRKRRRAVRSQMPGVCSAR